MSDSKLIPGPREFVTPSGDVLVYHYARTKCQQLQAALSIWTLYNERVARLPSTNAERNLIELDNTTPRALAHLLLKKGPSGLVPYDVTAAQTEILTMINDLSSEEWVRLQEVKADFFTRHKLLDSESMQRSSASEHALRKAASYWAIARQMSDVGRAPSSSSESKDSSTPTNPSGDSSKRSTSTSSGSSPTAGRKTSRSRVI